MVSRRNTGSRRRDARCRAEVSELDDAARVAQLVDEHVAGGDIGVDKAGCLDGYQRMGDLVGDCESVAQVN